MNMIIKLRIDKIIAKPEFMVRSSLDETLVTQYGQNIEEILEVAPIEVWHTVDGYILTDGFHRLAAAKEKNLVEVNVTLRFGTIQEAYAAACLANLRHGKPLTRVERERAVKEYIKIKVMFSDGVIAKDVGVSSETIRRYRQELEAAKEIEPQEKRIYSDGSTRSIPIGSTNVEPEPEPKSVDILNNYTKAIIESTRKIEGYKALGRMAAEVQIRAERRAGEFANDMNDNEKDGVCKDFGIDRYELSRWMILGAMTPEYFEKYLVKAIEEEEQRNFIGMPLEGALEGVGGEEVEVKRGGAAP